ncbi:MAG: type II secretion system F family protein [Planctomycetes bacterium]|nr:type II secretion system F family protein [Planctomycetota bacterium]
MIVTYQAIDRSGALVNDNLVVDDASQVYSELARNGLIPVSITEQKSRSTTHIQGLQKLCAGLGFSKAPDPRRAKRKELPFFTEQMAILLETGTPVAASLSALERQLTCPHWRLLVGQLKKRVIEGASLASAVGAYPEIFDPIFSSMISAGEASGKLSTILSRLAQLSRQSDRLKHKVISAMIYPALLTTIALSVIMVLIFFVLPRFSAIFIEMNVELPGSTKTLLAISDIVRNHFILVLISAVSVITSLVLWIRSQRGKRFIARTALKIPVIGSLICSTNNARICRLIGLLVESSITLLDAIELTCASVTHFMFVDLLEKMHGNVLVGRSMHEIMAETKIVPASITQMVHTGEENAQVGRIMTLLADHLDDRNETRISTLTSVMEPLILIFMGMIIGTVAISLVLPMFDLSRIS